MKMNNDIIAGVPEAEEVAITGYNKPANPCPGCGYVTRSLATTLLADEEHRCQQFNSYTKEYRTK